MSSSDKKMFRWTALAYELDHWEEEFIINKNLSYYVEELIIKVILFFILSILFVFEMGSILITVISFSMIAFFSIITVALVLGYWIIH